MMEASSAVGSAQRSRHSYPKLAILSIGGTLLFASNPATAQTVEDTQLWSAVTVNGSLSDKIIYAGDGQFRVIDNLSRYGQSVLRGSIGVKLTPRLSMSVGYAHSWTERSGRPTTFENRTFQQFTVAVPFVPGASMITRGRLEQRWFNTGRDTGWRYRQFVRLNIPLGKQAPAFIASEETFINLNNTDWGARSGFDQQRVMVGVALPLARRFSVETGYQIQYSRRLPADLVNHTIPITLAMRF